MREVTVAGEKMTRTFRIAVVAGDNGDTVFCKTAEEAEQLCRALNETTSEEEENTICGDDIVNWSNM